MNIVAERFSLSAIVAFLRRLFNRKTPAVANPDNPPIEIAGTAVLDAPAVQAAPAQAPAIKPKRAKRAAKTERGAPAADLSALLDSLDNVFISLQLPPSAYSTLPPSEVKGLKAASPLVTSINWANEATSVDVASGLPTTFIVAVDDNMHKREKGFLYPDFVYGCKIKKVPWNVTRLPGIVYRFGLAWRSEAKEHYWRTFWLAVQSDGSIRVAHELTSVPVRTKNGEYTRRDWVASSWRDKCDDPISAVVNVFCNVLKMYQQRKQRWNVSVRKGGHRAVFLVNKEDTPTYFRSRDKTALTQQGKRRPILHFVRAHTQTHADMVVNIPEHIRGLRSFNWNGYECAITAPAFHVWNSADLELAGEEHLDDDLPAGTINLEDLCHDLADREDYLQKRKTKQRKA